MFALSESKYFSAIVQHIGILGVVIMTENRSLAREEPNYFGAGPAMLPTDVLQQAAYDLVRYQDETVGVGEIPHRGAKAVKIIDDTKENISKLLDVPETHEVFFLQGGATSGFSAIPYNLLASYAKSHNKKGKAAYAVTGMWSKKAAAEASRLGFDVDVVVDSKGTNYSDFPPCSEWKKIDKDTAYLYYCDNETANGIEYQDAPGSSYLPEGVELVADMSSNILSKALDVSKYGLIVAGAQKNVGVAGLTIYIIKKSLLEHASDETLRELGVPLAPIVYHFPSAVANNSLYNTIPVFTCHVLNLVTKDLVNRGGITEIQRVNEEKAKLLYDAIEKYSDVYKLQVTNPKLRSNMNVVFTLKNKDLDSKFLKGAEERKLEALKGHRNVGGFRASIYNAVSLSSVQKLAKFVEEFAAEL